MTTKTAMTLNVRNVSCAFKYRTIIHDLTAHFTAGQLTALTGASGSGKTTLLNMLGGLIVPDTGSIEFDGHNLATMSSRARRKFRRANVGYLFQDYGLVSDLTVEENIKIAVPRVSSEALAAVLADVGLGGSEKRTVSELSGGEQQRIRFALAILGNPDILILDEPTAGMDAGARSQFWQSMRRQSEQGRTIIFATHYLKEAEEFAERIVLMHEGEIIADGTTYELQNMSSERIVTAEFPGEIPELADIPGVTANEIHGHHLRLVSQDSDALARYLLSETDARNLSITNPSLENMFLELTNQNQEI